MSIANYHPRGVFTWRNTGRVIERPNRHSVSHIYSALFRAKATTIRSLPSSRLYISYDFPRKRSLKNVSKHNDESTQLRHVLRPFRSSTRRDFFCRATSNLFTGCTAIITRVEEEKASSTAGPRISFEWRMPGLVGSDAFPSRGTRAYPSLPPSNAALRYEGMRSLLFSRIVELYRY